MKTGLNLINQSYLGGHRVKAVTSPQELSVDERTRGDKGKTEAIERGAVLGNGPSAGIKTDGRDVILWGLPGMLDSGALKGYLGKLRLVNVAPNGRANCQVARVSGE